MANKFPRLGVNIDHVATLRQARYKIYDGGLTPEPSILDAAREALRGGGHSITVHLREDRRHIQDEDVRTLRAQGDISLNLEMAVTPAMVKEALRYQPDDACLVPEKRQEVTTEGGLDVAREERKIKKATAELSAAGIMVSCFIDPIPEQVHAAARVGAAFIELHTGTYANVRTARQRQAELKRHAHAAKLAQELGLRVNAGHGLNLDNVGAYVQSVPGIEVLNIGHSIVARALFVGLAKAVREMRAAIRAATR